jgi:processive 1,2-diacylglycerol beta-glucosyltransferase
MALDFKRSYEAEPQKETSADYWEEITKEIERRIRNMTALPLKIESYELLHSRFAILEKQLTTFQEDLWKAVSLFLPSTLSKTDYARKLGTFRRRFQEINNAYGELKAKLLRTAVDEHLLCHCHFSSRLSQWPINNRIIDVHEHTPPNPSRIRKQSKASLLVFTCGGGHGHLSATKAMGQNMFGKYHILVADTLEDTLASYDILKKLPFDISQEKLYNYLLKNEKFKLLKLLIAAGPLNFRLHQKKIEHLIRLEVLKQNPDMLISCMPFINSMILNIAKELKLPFLVIPTDLDTRSFSSGMTTKTCDLHYPHYRFALAYDVPEMRQLAEPYIPKEKICISGFPVRPAFNEELSEEALLRVRQKYHIEKDAKVILIMMGGNAGLATENYARILAAIKEEELKEDMPQKLHVLCLCGDQRVAADQEMYARINALSPKSPRVTIQGIPATSEIDKLMSISDILITKPGGCTTNEALAKNLPTIFHAPFALMDWEIFNMEFCIKQNMGARFKLQSHLGHLTQGEIVRNKIRLLPLIKEAFKQKLAAKEKKLFEKKDFRIEFDKLVEELLKSNQN